MNFYMRMIALIALPLALAACLAACGANKPATDTREAGGEVLEGSASDAMLPIDTVRSQPPLAPRTEAAKDGKADRAAPAATTDAEPSAAPESPQAEATPDAG